MRISPFGATPMSAEVPPTSSVITSGARFRGPASIPAISAPTGPDSSRLTGLRSASAGATMPPLEVIRRSCAGTPACSSAVAKRRI